MITNTRNLKGFKREGSVEPLVGMGATYTIGSDRYPYTIIAVSASGKRCTIQQDETKRMDKNGMSEQQTYRFIPNPEAEKKVISLRQDGRWREVGSGGAGFYTIGDRDCYRDPSF